MGGVISKVFGGGSKSQGPSAAEKAAQLEAQNRATEQREEADRLASLSTQLSSRRKTLAFAEKKSTTGG
jgi:hypothetical protein